MLKLSLSYRLGFKREQSQVANDANRIALMQAQAQAQKDAAQQLEIEGRLKRAAQKGNILDGYSGN